MALDALIATAKPRLLASVRRQATPQTIGTLIRTSGVWDLMKARGIRSTGHNVVVYRDEPGRDLMHAPGGIPSISAPRSKRPSRATASSAVPRRLPVASSVSSISVQSTGWAKPMTRSTHIFAHRN
jgi:hypothetical protein